MVDAPVNMIVVFQIPAVLFVGIDQAHERHSVIYPVAQPEDARSAGQRRIEAVRLLRVIRIVEAAHDFLQRLRHHFLLCKDPVPVGIHASVQWLVVEQLRGPFGGVNFGNLGSDDQPGDFEQLVRRDGCVADDGIGIGGIS